MIGAVGVANLQHVNMNSARNLFVFGLSLLFGLGLPQWVRENRGSIHTGQYEPETIGNSGIDREFLFYPQENEAAQILPIMAEFESGPESIEPEESPLSRVDGIRNQKKKMQ